MHPLATLPYTEVELHWDIPLAGPAQTRTRQLRGALAHAFRGNSLFHQHDAAGRQIYRYPRIQYRWHRGLGLVTGWLDAAEILRNLPWLDLELTLGEEQVRVTDAIITVRNAEFGISPRLLHYHLTSPALLFNQENYPRFQRLGAADKQREQDRLLIAQLLTALRGVDIEFPDRLYAGLINPHSRKCRYKQQDLLGLTGRFVCNALLPPGFAIGHAVSHGYGWIAPWEQMS
jgi:hypothetical protein